MPVLAQTTRSHGVQIVQPVGNTCSEIAQFAETPLLESRISEPDAEAIRGGEAMEVDPMATYKVNKITELNLKTGHCQVDVDGVGSVVGQITDPGLGTPNNVYTRKMNDQAGVEVHAKAVKKNGEIHRLYISNAE